MNSLWPLVLITFLQPAPGQRPIDVERLFESGKSWAQFLSGVVAQRELWTKTEAAVAVPPDFVERARNARRGLRLLVVTEDWCADSAYSIPYIARLAQSAGIPLRIVGREAGEPVMRAHPTADGRTVTPTVVMLRDGRDAGAWVERPVELQRMFLSMSTDPESAKRFSQRHLWYESDGGLTVLKEVLAVIEQTTEKK